MASEHLWMVGKGRKDIVDEGGVPQLLARSLGMFIVLGNGRWFVRRRRITRCAAWRCWMGRSHIRHIAVAAGEAHSNPP